MALIQNFGLFIVSGVISMLNIPLLQIVVIKFFLDYHALFPLRQTQLVLLPELVNH
jgi:hypothetical protein